MEYYPGKTADYLKYKRYGGLGYLGYNTLKTHGLNAGELMKLKNSASKAAVNVAVNVGKRMSKSSEKVVNNLTRNMIGSFVM
jgi:hypothetical protein